eukprot:TRINITY_DN15172_c0_g2_i17.p1 TRINITY_DN15172_c0_g2~~TRINITY_DN15172_c0_g2_i17.p1  ORF type:complete len:100 (+),score=1.59 TRINITY_DN15172_c0_g2_i17:724-1023(+)
MDFAMLPRLSNLMNIECESDSYARLPWDTEVAVDNFPKSFLLEEREMLFLGDEKDFTDYMSVQVPQSFARLFNTCLTDALLGICAFGEFIKFSCINCLR